MSPIAILAPSDERRIALARPIPEAAPVMIAILSSSRRVIVDFLCSVRAEWMAADKWWQFGGEWMRLCSFPRYLGARVQGGKG